MKRALLFLAVAASWSETDLFAATIAITNKDPRINNPDLIDRDWGARLRNFRTPEPGNEIYIGSGDLSFSGNRNVADLVWNKAPGLNTFPLTYAPSPLITMTATGSTSASQSYNFQTPVANPNQPFNNILIQLQSPNGTPDITITNLVLSVRGGATTNLGNIENKAEVWALISDIGSGAYASGFTLAGNIVVESSQGSEQNPSINFFSIFDRTQVPPDLTLTKSHAGNFTQGQAGATYTITVSNISTGPTSGTITVIDNFPPALIPTDARGPQWNCNISTNTATCTRSHPL